MSVNNSTRSNQLVIGFYKTSICLPPALTSVLLSPQNPRFIIPLLFAFPPHLPFTHSPTLCTEIGHGQEKHGNAPPKIVLFILYRLHPKTTLASHAFPVFLVCVWVPLVCQFYFFQSLDSFLWCIGLAYGQFCPFYDEEKVGLCSHTTIWLEHVNRLYEGNGLYVTPVGFETASQWLQCYTRMVCSCNS